MAYEKDPVYTAILEHAQQDCILFLGSGIHKAPVKPNLFGFNAGSILPDQSELARRMAAESNFAKELAAELPTNLQRVSLHFEHAPGKGRKALIDFLRKQLQDGKQPSVLLHMLARLPFTIFVTTNYDQLLEIALEKAGKKPYVLIFTPDSDKPTRDIPNDPSVNRPLVYKMHGDINDRESVVITDEDYITFIQRMSDKPQVFPVPETVMYRLKRWPTLFLGYSLQEYNLRLLFRTLRWRLDPADYPMSFSVDPYRDPLILKVWQEKRRFITFLVQDLWEFIPQLYQDIIGEEFTGVA